MKTALAAIIVFSLVSGLAAQSAQAPAGNTPPPHDGQQGAGQDLNAVLADLQRLALGTNGDISNLRIERWKADNSQKQQMQQVATSLQRNITSAVPSLISDLQAAPSSVSRAFKLYHNVNVLYEFLNSLAEAAGEFGRREEYEPLANDASSLDHIRQRLSGYIERAAVTLENPPKPPAVQAQTAQPQPAKKVVVDDNAPPKKTNKKKKASTTSSPPPSKPQ